MTRNHMLKPTDRVSEKPGMVCTVKVGILTYWFVAVNCIPGPCEKRGQCYSRYNLLVNSKKDYLWYLVMMMLKLLSSD